MTSGPLPSFSALATTGDRARFIRDAWAHAESATDAQRDELLPALAPLIASWPEEELANLVLLAGALVERGAPCASFPLVMFDRIGAMLARVPDPSERAVSDGDDHGDDDADDDADDDGDDDGDESEYELPDAFYACERAAAAVLGRSVELRRALPHKPGLLAQIRRYSERYGFLGKMLQVLDDEALLVVHARTVRVWRARCGGIADNFQLHTLLRGALAGGSHAHPDAARIPGAPPDARALAAATDGDVEDAPAMSSDWQLAGWRALKPGGLLPGAEDTAHWIWNEGFPAEIEPLATPAGSARIVCVGPSTIERSWHAQRVFAGMPAWLRVEGALAEPAARAVIAAIHAAQAR